MDIQTALSAFLPVSLEEMSGIRLMNRTDTKFVTSLDKLSLILQFAVTDYRVQEVEGTRNIAYRTVYLDTSGRDMYMAHQNGHRVREKIRVRTYVSSGLTFLEVKNKDNKGRTDKRRKYTFFVCRRGRRVFGEACLVSFVGIETMVGK